MKRQILVQLQGSPNGTSPDIAAHAAAAARHRGADVHAMVVDATFRQASSLLGDRVEDVDALVADARARCRARGPWPVRATEERRQQPGAALRSTRGSP